MTGAAHTTPRAGRGAASADHAAPPDTPSESFRELVELDLAQSVRWAKRASAPTAIEPETLDLAMLELIARFEHVLSSQLHRRFNRGRAITTTQRRLKRLSDAGLVERFQFHRRDGGGVPMCYVVSAAGRELLRGAGRLSAEDERPRQYSRVDAERRLGQARHDVHVAGWALALLTALGAAATTLRGPAESVLAPPSRATSGGGRAALGPSGLRLPGGRVPHDFLAPDSAEEPREVDRYDTIRPHALIELRERAIDVIVECDDQLATSRGAAKLLRYDHFLAGWSVHTRRYGERREASAIVVFVCRSRDRARSCARHADATLRACRAYAGEYPFDWDYPGREHTLFVAERDVHDGVLVAYGVPRLPPIVRVAEAHGDPRAGEATAEPRELPH